MTREWGRKDQGGRTERGRRKERRRAIARLGKDEMEFLFFLFFSLFLFFLFVVAFWAKAQSLEFMQSNLWVPSIVA